ncbi:hypothetical protein LTR70_007829 [Exophiala xenobiotica]|uniref:U3 small nucleolar RNA-associated protein 11 n=1 Tax=Lithohypha guttulata TaxID=1690604 RepID=A0ABR0JZM4_9EURO|nr:hypothetical protein LTR24_008559 [Lithohypha guttulata]KAK5312989.1 hypothetical protein LTR70_007829 [Exophiala xenobiotica]
MSSLRNAVTRRPHKERSQPTTRTKWGLLEKHKDYSLRARDFNQKKAKLNILQQKTRDRHPDEFSFGMLSQQGGQGKHGQRAQRQNQLSHEAASLLKTQDAGYLRNAAQRTRREVERVEEEVGVDGAVRREREVEKLVFDEEGEPVKKRVRLSRGTVEDEEPHDEGENGGVIATTPLSTSNKATPKVLSRKQAEKEKDRLSQLKADRKRRKRLQELRTAKLEALKKRQKEIQAAANELELQRAKMGNVIGGTNKHGVKFKLRERKR